MKCECPYTLKVPLGNAFQVLFPVKTAEWKDGERTVEVADVRALTDIVVKVDGEEWQDWEMDERGPLVNFPKDSLAKGPHNVEVTADYFGVAIRAAYFECITMVQWSYESNIGNYIIGSPLESEAAYIYVGITDDEELEALKQQYREATAACETARLQYEAAKEEFDEKAEQLDDVAKETTSQSIRKDISSTASSTADLIDDMIVDAELELLKTRDLPYAISFNNATYDFSQYKLPQGQVALIEWKRRENEDVIYTMAWEGVTTSTHVYPTERSTSSEYIGTISAVYKVALKDVEEGILALANNRDTPISIVVNGDTYNFAGYEENNGRLWIYWSGATDLYTVAAYGVYVGQQVYNGEYEDIEHRVGTITAVTRITLADIYDLICNIDFSTLAKQGDNPAATNSAILEALSHINPQDPNSKALAEFFGVTLLQGYEFMTDTEVTDELEDIMQALDPELLQEVEYPEGSGTYMTKAQAITAEAMQIINPSQS